MLNSRSMSQWLQLLQQHKAIAVVRCANFDLAYQMALAVAAGGINLIEVTWNSDRPGELITRLKAELPHCTIGTGTILSLEQLQQAVSAGAEFAVSPHYDPALLSVSKIQHQIPYIPGVCSPSEMVRAWQQGAIAVKVFPIKSLGGAEYIKCLQGPLGQIAMIPTGGITLENARIMTEAGAIAVGISSNLFPPEAIANRDWAMITERATVLCQSLQNGRG